MFDIQDCKFNKTVTAVESNLILGEYWKERLDETKDDFKRSELCDDRSVEVLELYTDSGYVRINKGEAINIARHFGLRLKDENK